MGGFAKRVLNTFRRVQTTEMTGLILGEKTEVMEGWHFPCRIPEP